jgi:uncharacterized protein with HEPN domain
MPRRSRETYLWDIADSCRSTCPFPKLEESISPARQIVGFRNRIVHEYAEVDTEIVCAIVQNEVSQLLEKADVILEESGHGG